jgi:hypothetical protein
MGNKGVQRGGRKYRREGKDRRYRGRKKGRVV